MEGNIMSGYTKVFASLLDSTVWGLGKEARLLWITLLLKKDRGQVVRASLPGLAHSARLTVGEVELALEELLAPDKYSQSREHEGRRIERVEGGWLVVNGEKYRDMLNLDDRREYQRLKQAEYRVRRRNAAWKKPLKGERAYLRAEKDGATEAQCDSITMETLPRGNDGGAK
jgi:hypothetical protein